MTFVMNQRGHIKKKSKTKRTPINCGSYPDIIPIALFISTNTSISANEKKLKLFKMSTKACN